MNKIKSIINTVKSEILFKLFTVKFCWRSWLARFISFVSIAFSTVSCILIPLLGIIYAATNISSKYTPIVIVFSLAYPFLAYHVVSPFLFRWNMANLNKAQEHMDYVFAKDIHDSIAAGEESREDIIKALQDSGYDNYQINHLMNMADCIED